MQESNFEFIIADQELSVLAMVMLFVSYFFLLPLLVQSKPVTQSRKTQTNSTTIVLTIPKGMIQIHVCCMSHSNGDKLIREAFE